MATQFAAGGLLKGHAQGHTLQCTLGSSYTLFINGLNKAPRAICTAVGVSWGVLTRAHRRAMRNLFHTVFEQGHTHLHSSASWELGLKIVQVFCSSMLGSTHAFKSDKNFQPPTAGDSFSSAPMMGSMASNTQSLPSLSNVTR